MREFVHATSCIVRLRKLSVPIDGVISAVEVEHRMTRSQAGQ
jgi:hypothetical protein